MEEGEQRTSSTPSIRPLSESKRWHLFCSRRTALQCLATHHPAFPRPVCRPALAHLRHQAEVWLLLRFNLGGGSHLQGRDTSPSHHGHLARPSDSQGRKAFPRPMEDVLQGHLHQGATQPTEAQAGYARPLLEAPHRETEITQKYIF